MATTSQSVRNPRNGDMDYQLEFTSDERLQQTVTTLRQAQQDWLKAGLDQRIAVMQQWQQSLQQHRTAILTALSADTGRVVESEMEFDTLLSNLQRWCQDAPTQLDETVRIDSATPGISAGMQVAPYPLVGVISPWNFPLLLSLLDAIPALLCGCAVLIKPSEVTPRFIDAVEQSITDIPELAAVLAYLRGDGSVGAALVQQADIVVFTGSVATGRKVGEQAAARFIPAFLELGGKDAALILKDADIPRSAAAIAWGGLSNAGQSCLSIERVYVDRTQEETFLQQLVAIVSNLRLCTDAPEQGGIGPIISDKQAEIIRDHLEDAIAKGAIVHTGGKVENINGGLWCFPTVLSNVSHDMKVMTEETFGPILPVMAFDSEQQAIELANDSPFGLSGAVFASTTERALTVAAQIDAGAISINDCALTAMMHEAEKQSFKLSGLGGSRMGAASIRRFYRKKALLINEQQLWDPWWFPAAK